MGFSGYSYTWSNHRKALDTVRVRLDRACASVGWRALFPTAQVVAEEARGSDHNPLIINLEAGAGHSRVHHRKMFRFEAMWTRSGACEDIIKNHWCSSVEGDAGSRIFQCTTQELEEQLAAVTKDPISDRDSISRKALRSELEEFLSREKIMWKQRGKAQWLHEGDMNTPYFTRGLVPGKRKTLFRSSVTRRVIGVPP
ncbi:UNVERIFIED_CONTAM: hypothetical protein Slati_1310200 [Sesamum latifolium]|uniref:Uncharacterized protein n=1 Tax=Sesamum latifolium TaxID=2727402 RepID=A0AAW2XHS3_9LAMI